MESYQNRNGRYLLPTSFYYWIFYRITTIGFSKGSISTDLENSPHRRISTPGIRYWNQKKLSKVRLRRLYSLSNIWSSSEQTEEKYTSWKPSVDTLVQILVSVGVSSERTSAVRFTTGRTTDPEIALQFLDCKVIIQRDCSEKNIIDLIFWKTDSNLPRAKLKKWECAEANGFIYIWYHAKNKSPNGKPKQFNKLLTNVFIGEYQFNLYCHLLVSIVAFLKHRKNFSLIIFKLWYTNSFDMTHFDVLHSMAGVLSSERVLTKPWIYTIAKRIFHFDFDVKFEEINGQDSHYLSNVTFIPVIFGKARNSLGIDMKMKLYPPTLHLTLAFPFFNAKFYVIVGSQPVSPTNWKLIFRMHCEPNIRSKIFQKLFMHIFQLTVGYNCFNNSLKLWWF